MALTDGEMRGKRRAWHPNGFEKQPFRRCQSRCFSPFEELELWLVHIYFYKSGFGTNNDFTSSKQAASWLGEKKRVGVQPMLFIGTVSGNQLHDAAAFAQRLINGKEIMHSKPVIQIPLQF